MELTNLSCETFLAELAGNAPAPGGGGAAALVGAAGAALGNMVGSLTVGKKKYAAVEADILVLNERSAALRKRLEGLVQADAEAFLPLAAAYKLPKETPEQQAHKAAVLEEALNRACAVPLEIMAACCEGITLAEEYAAKGSVLALSDAGCAALFCKAALQAAGLNVTVNTRLMADKARAAALNAEAAALLADFFIAAGLLLWFKIRQTPLSEAVCLRRCSGWTAGFCSFAGIVLYVLTDLALSLLPEAWMAAYNADMSVLTSTGLNTFLTMAVLGPLAEELTFRGVIQTRLERAMPPWLALVLQAAIFGLVHGTPIQMVYAFLMGLAFGFLRRRTGSILPGSSRRSASCASAPPRPTRFQPVTWSSTLPSCAS